MASNPSKTDEEERIAKLKKFSVEGEERINQSKEYVENDEQEEKRAMAQATKANNEWLKKRVQNEQNEPNKPKKGGRRKRTRRKRKQRKKNRRTKRTKRTKRTRRTRRIRKQTKKKKIKKK